VCGGGARFGGQVSANVMFSPDYVKSDAFPHFDLLRPLFHLYRKLIKNG